MKFGPFVVEPLLLDKFIRLLVFMAAVACGILFVVSMVGSLDYSPFVNPAPPGGMPIIMTEPTEDCALGKSIPPPMNADSIKYTVPDRRGMMAVTANVNSLPFSGDTSNPCMQRYFDSVRIYLRSDEKEYAGVRIRKFRSAPETLFVSVEKKKTVSDSSSSKQTSVVNSPATHELDSLISYVVNLAERKANRSEPKQDSLFLEWLKSRKSDLKDSMELMFLRDVHDSVYDGVARKDTKICIMTTKDYARRHHRELHRPSLGSILGGLSGALSSATVESVYYYEYGSLEAPRQPQWERLLKVLFALAILATIVQRIYPILKKPLKNMEKRVYKWAAGTWILNWLARRRYVRSVARKYEVVKIPFGLERSFPMKDIYVPLRGERDTISENVDIFQELERQRRIMITGMPGAGKSMLLSRIAFDLVRTDTKPVISNCIPVLLELHRVKGEGKSLVPDLEQAFKRHEFPGSRHFVRRNLEKGKLMLLLDGLDEVNPRDYKSVVEKIQDLLETYHSCPAVVTCRTAVYRDEFRDCLNRRLEVVSFKDKDIHRFLSNWGKVMKEDMPKDKSMDDLIQGLDERPKIKILATNPLLLTILTCLYSDPTFRLPHSRSEFYKKSTTWLLEQWKRQHNQYEPDQKHIILQHLALYMLDASIEKGEDRRTIEKEKGIELVRQVADKINLDKTDAPVILDEIVKRSGLLLKVDGGMRYQFVHLSLQEYFAACKLELDVDGLLRRFIVSPEDWSEVVKLWCGGPRDSSEVIRRIFQENPKTGFECLADAREVDDNLTTTIVTRFREELWKDEEQGPIVSTFGSVAADARPRGRGVFEFLKDTLKTSDSPIRRSRAAFALAASKHTDAVKTLAEGYAKLEEARRALEAMGNLAVRELERAAEKDGFLTAVDSLAEIGTPDTVEALVRIMYSSRADVAERAAWRLGNRLRHIEVEAELSSFKLNRTQRHMSILDWVWEPYVSTSISSLKHIVGRIAYLIKNTPAERLPEIDLSIDKRITIPLALEEDLTQLRFALESRPFATPEGSEFPQNASVGKKSMLSLTIEAARTRLRELVFGRGKLPQERGVLDEALSKEIVRTDALSDHLRKFVSGFSSTELVDLFGLLLGEKNLPRRSDWERLRTQLDEYGNDVRTALRKLAFRERRLSQFIRYLAVLSFFALMSIASVIQLPATRAQEIPVRPESYVGWVIGAIVALVGWLLLIFDKRHISIKYPKDFFNFGVRGIFYVPQKYIFGKDAPGITDVRLLFTYSWFIVWFLALLSSSLTLVWNTFGAAYVIIVIISSPILWILWQSLGFASLFKEDTGAATALVPILNIWYRFIEKH